MAERMSEEGIAELARLADECAASPQAYLAHALRRAVAELRRERERADEAAKREREACATFVRGFQRGTDPEHIADQIDMEKHHG